MAAEDQAEIVNRLRDDKGSRDAHANAKQVIRQVARDKTISKIESEPKPLPTGKFRVIVADPPWAYTKRKDDGTHRAALTYPDMTTDEICEMGAEIISRAHDDAVLWLWTTNAFMRDAFRVVDAWGFQEKTILTWAKSKMGTGDWLRGKTEHCILAVRGKPVVNLTNQTTLLDGVVREHSRKPDEFYALVESLCPGSKLEIFAREQRVGWSGWGAESEKFGDEECA
jgi:N6-adenosine-specific RNA methylase IME4